MPYMKWGAKRRRSKPIYNRRKSKNAEVKIAQMHLRWLNKLSSMKYLQGGGSYPTRKKTRSVMKYINRPGVFYPRKLYRTGYKRRR